MTHDTRQFCRRMALLHVSHWRDASGLPKTRAWARQRALWWISKAKDRT